MAERYWEPGEAPGGDPLKDWVSENMIEALTQMINEGGAWIGVTDGKLTVTFHSLDMPEKEGEPSDIWHKDFDLLEMAMKWAADYDGLPQLSDEQREDLEERACLLDELAAKFRARAGLSPNGEVRGAIRPAGEASSAEGATSTVVLEGGATGGND